MEYIVIYKLPNGYLKTEYVKAGTAQKAVDTIRRKQPEVKIREVARVMKSWV